jgi:hypothetical protein
VELWAGGCEVDDRGIFFERFGPGGRPGPSGLANRLVGPQRVNGRRSSEPRLGTVTHWEKRIRQRVSHRRQLAPRCHLTAAGPEETGGRGWGLLRTGPRDGRTRSVRGSGPTCLWNSFLPPAVHEPSSFSMQQGKARAATNGRRPRRREARVVEEWGPLAGARVTSRVTKHGAVVHNSESTSTMLLCLNRKNPFGWQEKSLPRDTIILQI